MASSTTFTIDSSLQSWNMPMKEWLKENAKDKGWDGVASANIVFNPEGKILLIQRAASDSMPNRWEVPGGAVDEDDPSILHGAARELIEESGLVAKRFTHLVTEGAGHPEGQVFPNRNKTQWFCRFTFEVEVENCDDVKLDPNEHQDFVWASEEEVKEPKGEPELAITTNAVAALILEAFRMRKESMSS